eukprot:gene6552-7595_t
MAKGKYLVSNARMSIWKALGLMIVIITCTSLMAMHLSPSCDDPLSSRLCLQSSTVDKAEESSDDDPDGYSDIFKKKSPLAHMDEQRIAAINERYLHDVTVLGDKEMQQFLTFVHYAHLYANVTVHSGNIFDYDQRNYVMPPRRPSYKSVDSIELIQQEMVNVKNMVDIDWQIRRRSLNDLQRRLVESQVVNDFYKYEEQELDYERLRGELGRVDVMPVFPMPLPRVHPSPLIPRPYLFLHVPKTGGNSIFNAFRVSYGYLAYQQWAMPDFDNIESMWEMSALVGHFNYGLHHLLSPEGQATHSYMTMLRDPIDRVVSHYYYHKNRREDEGHPLANRLSLDEWIIQSPRGQNEQTRVLSGLTIGAELFPTNETFRMALHHLRSMKFVGLTERFGESLVLIKYYCGLESVTERILNKGKVKPNKESISLKTLELIREKNWMDIYLYQEAQKMFERQLDIVGRDLVNKELGRMPEPSESWG